MLLRGVCRTGFSSDVITLLCPSRCGGCTSVSVCSRLTLNREQELRETLAAKTAITLLVTVSKKEVQQVSGKEKRNSGAARHCDVGVHKFFRVRYSSCWTLKLGWKNT